jgi:hypothetical protein
MRSMLLLFSLALTIGGCRSGIDCGVYVYDEARQVCVCPEGTVELPGGGCAASDGGAGDAGGDAGMVDVGTVDAARDDGGPSCVAETCNGADDDCDGLTDEGVLTAGDAILAASDSALQGGRLVSLDSGFGVVAEPWAMPSNLSWIRLANDGVPSAAGVGLGSDVTRDGPLQLDVRRDGSMVLLAFLVNGGSPFRLIGFDALSAVRSVGATPVDIPVTSGRTGGLHVRIAAVSPGRATIYVLETDPVGDVSAIRRLRVDTTGATPFVIDSFDAGADVNPGAGWEVLSTSSADYLVFQTMAGDLTVSVGPSGDAAGTFRVAGIVASGGAAAPFDVALESRSVRKLDHSDHLGVRDRRQTLGRDRLFLAPPSARRLRDRSALGSAGRDQQA